MCQATPVNNTRPISPASQAALPIDEHVKAPVSIDGSDSSSSGGLRLLICSENVPPQVNGIARRIGMYADGLRDLGCDVGKSFCSCLCYTLSTRLFHC